MAFERDGVSYRFHHVGIPTDEPRPGERYSAVYRMYTSDDPCQHARVQWHRYEPGSPLHELMKTRPHVAFQVSDLQRAIQGHTVILGPYEPVPGYRVAVIEDGGIGIELVQTDLSPQQLWAKAESEGVLYRDDEAAREEARRGLTGSDDR